MTTRAVASADGKSQWLIVRARDTIHSPGILLNPVLVTSPMGFSTPTFCQLPRKRRMSCGNSAGRPAVGGRESLVMVHGMGAVQGYGMSSDLHAQKRELLSLTCRLRAGGSGIGQVEGIFAAEFTWSKALGGSFPCARSIAGHLTHSLHRRCSCGHVVSIRTYACPGTEIGPHVSI